MTRLHSLTLAETGLASDQAAQKPVRRWINVCTAALVATALFLWSAAPLRAEDHDDLAKALIAVLALGALLQSPDKIPTATPVRHPGGPDVCAFDINSPRVVGSENCQPGAEVAYHPAARCTPRARILGAQCTPGAEFHASGR